SADIGHYIGDAHVPLHASSNHNGQFTDQRGIHGFWESRIPELFAEKEWDLVNRRAVYISEPQTFIWSRVFESGLAADSVLKIEKDLNTVFPSDRKYAYSSRNGLIVKSYSEEYSRKYHLALHNMTERRFRQSIQAVASFWYTAWVNAGQPDLRQLTSGGLLEPDEDFSQLKIGRAH